MSFRDHFSKHSVDYAKFRPRYPRELYQFIADQSPGRDVVWDCATGNGQAAMDLADFFSTVLATDASESQLKNAFPVANVHYSVATAEASGLADQSLDAITVAQALHWFDFDRFYQEVRRVSRPGAIIAAWCNRAFRGGPAVDDLLKDLFINVIEKYWAPEIKYVEEEYCTIPFPFQDVPAPQFTLSTEWNAFEYAGYIKTWSAVQNVYRQEGTEKLKPFFEQLIEAWGDHPEERKTLTSALHLRIGRV